MDTANRGLAPAFGHRAPGCPPAAGERGMPTLGRRASAPRGGAGRDAYGAAYGARGINLGKSVQLFYNDPKRVALSHKRFVPLANHEGLDHVDTPIF
jgi:hypothetical protein